ncbi:MAG: hypothetical protein JXB17_11630 [Bacteroidales bacterium]|nr:hypothetical protein [Bacteroidales bacterium]
MKKIIFFFLFIISISNVNSSNFQINNKVIKNNYTFDLINDYNNSDLLYFKNYSLNNQLNSTSLLTSESSKSRIKYGYIAGPVVLGLAIAAEITKQEQIPAMPLGISSVVISMISVPIISTNAFFLSDEWKRVKTASWVAYTGGMLCSGLLISMGIMEITPPTPVIAVTGVMLSTSIVLMTHCTKHSNISLSNKLNKKSNLNFGLIPLKDGGICTFALNF